MERRRPGEDGVDEEHGRGDRHGHEPQGQANAKAMPSSAMMRIQNPPEAKIVLIIAGEEATTRAVKAVASRPMVIQP